MLPEWTPTYQQIVAAQERLRTVALRTPLLESDEINRKVGGRVLIKAECMQRSGSFKLRGAYNKIVQLTKDERKRGVVAYSSGNHAAAVATAAGMIGTAATVVIPEDAPRIKIDNILRLGARTIFYNRFRDRREDLAANIVRQTGAILIPTYDDGDIIAGQATVALEIIDQLTELDVRADALLAGCGTGGLVAGCALALWQRGARTKVYAVEPLGFDRIGRSLKAGNPVSIPGGGLSICDSLMTLSPGELTFAIIQALSVASVAVSDSAVAAALLVSFRELKLVLEPGGAAALSAILTGSVDGRSKTIVVVCSGGNVDPDSYAKALNSNYKGVADNRDARLGATVARQGATV